MSKFETYNKKKYISSFKNGGVFIISLFKYN